ncbi:rho guanine nucleotide exchange factor 28-like [Melopsittacus undulatus]|uniref:rho guanine nucleotide exchange factor 28-like n=1 Tax=Melopsittacus undulatus TaxID=13146 RepID=UPI00146C6AD2|nr:rho guanine nucleotide exchange factor 28-like [Melopsittacus undulatus]
MDSQRLAAGPPGGQVIIHAKFDKDIYLPKDAEFYFVYDGSLKRHVMFAERVSDNALRSIVAECVTAASHELLLDKFGLRTKDLQSLDNDLMMAVAYEELPSTWNILGSCSEEPKHKETLLHLVMKLGLIKLSQFLAAQPGGSSALALPNDDGATPLDLALQNGHSELVKVFTKSCELGIW